jgi:hypothetical protein
LKRRSLSQGIKANLSFGIARHGPTRLRSNDEGRQRLRPLTDEEAAIILNRDPRIAREWRKWNAMSGNQGSLIIIDGKRVQAVLKAATEEPGSDDDVMGLA